MDVMTNGCDKSRLGKPTFGLFKVGYVRQGKQWIDDLKNFLGKNQISSRIDFKEISYRIQRQLDSAETYRDAQNEVVSKDRATRRLFYTGLREDGAQGKIVYACFVRNTSGCGADWVGVDFELGKPIYFRDIAYMENDKDWRDALRNANDNRCLDVGKVERSIVANRWSSCKYYYYDGSMAEAETADFMVFDTGCYFPKTREPILARFWRAKNKLSWNGVAFIAEKEIAVQRSEIKNHDSLLCAARMPSGWEEQLKKIAREESWTVDPLKPNSVLSQYLKLTYFRLRQQGGGAILEKENVCMIFNTGLVDRRYNFIHAYFVPNTSGACRWELRGFGTRFGKSLVDRELRDHLSDDLMRAKWFNDISDLCFDYEKTVAPCEDHCLAENALRLPRVVFERVLEKKEEREDFLALYDDLKKHKSSNHDYVQAACYERLKSYSDYDYIMQGLMKELGSAIDLAKKIVSIDYTAAVPMYYPGKGRFSMLLPLSFGRPEDVGCALVVERNKAGSYVGVTILTREMAYADARLLRRPDAQWIQIIDETGPRSS